MTIDLHQIDAIQDYDQAIEALESFVEELVKEFVESPEAEAYLQEYPEMEDMIGSWIDNLLYFGYAYESVTLPRMTKQTVNVILTELFPRKISLMMPEDANTTIPELIAFWQYLKRQYKLRSADGILKLLKQLQPNYPNIMNDSSKFGMAKSFFMEGIGSGFDMSTPEGLQAFQEHYNQQLANPPSPSFQQAATPDAASLIQSDYSAFLGGSELSLDPASDALGDVEMMPGQVINLAEVAKMLDSLPEELANTPEALELRSALNFLSTGQLFRQPDDSGPDDFWQEMRSNLWTRFVIGTEPPSEEAIALLQQQQITETEPGPILKDFQTILEFVGEGIPVSGVNHLFPLKALPELNERLSTPIPLDLKRPQMKSYPTIQGLYLLVRSTGLAQITAKGKKPYMVLNPEALQSWNSLNPTERYFTLLEAWLLHAHEEMLGGRGSPYDEGSKCIQFFSNPGNTKQTLKDYNAQDIYNYYPEYHNLALMHLFGMLDWEVGKPGKGKGFRLKSFEQRPLGQALIRVMLQGVKDELLEPQGSMTPGFGTLQPVFQPYFPEWQNNLTLPQSEVQSGVYTFKVSLGKIWRRLAISSQMSLFALSRLILESVDFDTDHLDEFSCKDAFGRTMRISHPYADGSPSTDQVLIEELQLPVGAMLTYVFDFGDWWEFTVQLEKIDPEDTRPDYAAILEQHGEPPEQYPDFWDEDGDEEDWDEDED
ncbi:IS1096 element passenger TnpR family protein [Egbenema bharatensis]|uniref:IS1096 element passenger TnpR family protein n=1 Tax=Egbenema bharatensis TaxID=3463334 RepID=UPI003A86972F